MEYHAATLGNTIDWGGGRITAMTTPVLGAGVWLVSWGTVLTAANGGMRASVQVMAGTAAATFLGQQAAEMVVGASILPGQSFSCECIAVITTAGTLLMSVWTNGTARVNYADTNTSSTGLTGYTAVKIA